MAVKLNRGSGLRAVKTVDAVVGARFSRRCRSESISNVSLMDWFGLLCGRMSVFVVLKGCRLTETSTLLTMGAFSGGAGDDVLLLRRSEVKLVVRFAIVLVCEASE